MPAAGLLLLGTLAVVGLWLQPRDDGKIVAIFPPWWSQAQSLAAVADIAPVGGAGGFPFVIALGSGSSRVRNQLRAAGALMIVDGSAYAFCVGAPQ